MVRTPLELWLIVEANFDKLFRFGLCSVCRQLHENCVIDDKEYIYLVEEISAYTFRRYGRIPIFTWIAGERKPRKSFIQKQILKQIRCKAE